MLFQFCHICTADDTKVNTHHEGTMTVVTTTCHNLKVFKKSFYLEKSAEHARNSNAAGNFLLCFGILNLVDRLVKCSTFFSTWDWDVYLCVPSSDTRE